MFYSQRQNIYANYLRFFNFAFVKLIKLGAIL